MGAGLSIAVRAIFGMLPGLIQFAEAVWPKGNGETKLATVANVVNMLHESVPLLAKSAADLKNPTLDLVNGVVGYMKQAGVLGAADASSIAADVSRPFDLAAQLGAATAAPAAPGGTTLDAIMAELNALKDSVAAIKQTAAGVVSQVKAEFVPAGGD